MDLRSMISGSFPVFNTIEDNNIPVFNIAKGMRDDHAGCHLGQYDKSIAASPYL